MQGMRRNCVITTCWLSGALACNVVHGLLNVAWKTRKLWRVWKGDPNIAEWFRICRASSGSSSHRLLLLLNKIVSFAW